MDLEWKKIVNNSTNSYLMISIWQNCYATNYWMPKSPGVSAYLIIDISASEKEMIKENMNNTCQNNFCIYIMLGFCPFLKVKQFFFLYLSSILQFLEIWHIELPELCNFWPFLSFFALIYKMALTATMIPDRKIKAHPRRSRERPGEKKKYEK